ncbi:hypothetical protein V6N13_013282 [Hibiscus sabdariffa]
MYVELELILSLVAAPTGAFFGFQLEPQFHEPYLATSLHNFWGRRWNLMAVFVVFVVSGLMHELFFYYWTRVAPTWEVTWFFVLHGVALAVEVAVKKAALEEMSMYHHRAVYGPLALGFVATTTFWLLFPQLVRNGVDH